MGRSGLRWGHGGDQSGLHQPLQVWAGGDGCHRGDKVGTRDGQICAKVLCVDRRAHAGEGVGWGMVVGKAVPGRGGATAAGG